MYDYVIVGSGLFGVVFAHEMKKAGRKCLVLERRAHVGGNVYCEEKKKASASIATGPTSSIRRIKKFGTMSISSSSLIITSIRRSLTTKESSTTCLLI